MNQNRNNNRRRGRGNNRGGQGGGSQGNRIDSRARGNAPQLLEKYKKLAHDASLNGDRVQTEYYLQFADHYFRVLADSRAQRDDQRPQRPNDREYGRDQAFDPAFDGVEDFDEVEETERAPERAPDRGQRPPRRERDEDRDDEAAPAEEGERATEGEDGDEPNPFLRDVRSGGGNRRPRTRSRGRQAEEAAPAEAAEGGFDPGLLPPSIVREEEAPARPAPRRRRARPAQDEGGETLEAVND